MTRWTADDIPDLTGRTALVTGANSGLGLASAEALARRGARVLLGCRDAGRGGAALEAVKAEATGPPPELVTLDLANLGQIRDAAEAVRASAPTLDILMNNAGVMATPSARTADGFELQFGTNHLGHFALTGLLLESLVAAPAPRVVSTSSQAHRIGRIRFDDLQWERGRYQRWPAYGQSKLANLLFTLELGRRAEAAAVPLTVAAAHPGYSATHLHTGAGNPIVVAVMGVVGRVVAQSATQGALPQLYAATSPDVRSGDYFGPDGPFESRGWPRRVGMTSAARDPEAARRLWTASEEATGVVYAWPNRR